MVERHKVEEFLYGNCAKVKRDGNGYVLRCPVCGDSKKNPNKRRCHVDYYAKYDEWIYTCYNGGCPNPSGNIQSLYMQVLGVSFSEACNVLEDRKYDGEKIKDRLSGHRTYVDEEDDKGELDLDITCCYTVRDTPPNIIGRKYVNVLRKFVVERRIPLKYQPMICSCGKYKNRIILPVYEGGKMVYFQGRAIYDDMEPKYLNPVVKKEDIIFNKERFERDKYIVVCEGQIDAMMVGNQGTTCLGAKTSDEFLEKLFPLTDKGIILALDNPLIDKSGYECCKSILEESRYAKKLKYFFMPDTINKDLNDLVRSKDINFLHDVYDFVVENSMTHFKTTMKMRNVV